MNMENKKSVIMQMLIDSMANSFSSESDDSDEEELFRKLIANPVKPVKKKKIDDHIISEFDDETFVEMFGISRNIANILIENYTASSYSPRNEKGKEKISSARSILVMLAYLRTKDSFRLISRRFDVSLSTAHSLLNRTLNFVLSQVDTYVKWPTAEEATYISNAFKDQHGIEGIMGVLDTCHIKINRPQIDGGSYKNMKGYHSVQLQGVVDHNKMFTDVYCGAGGSSFKFDVLQNSSIYAKCQSADVLGDKFLIGDSGYPLLPSLVTPFQDNGILSEDQKMFNDKLSASRLVADEAFGLLKGRFRRLEHFLNSDVRLILKSIMCACVLHNLCIAENDKTEIQVDYVPEKDDYNGFFFDIEHQDFKREEAFQKMLMEQ